MCGKKDPNTRVIETLFTSIHRMLAGKTIQDCRLTQASAEILTSTFAHTQEIDAYKNLVFIIVQTPDFNTYFFFSFFFLKRGKRFQYLYINS